MLETEGYTIETFHGGFTDFYINAESHKFKTGDNLLLLRVQADKAKLIMRQGSVLADALNPQVPSGQKRVGTLMAFDDNAVLFAQAERKLSYGGTTLQGPTSNELFASATTNANVTSYAYWNKHLFITNDDLTTLPTKIYRDGSSNLQLRTAGMPALASAPVCTLTMAGTNNYLYRFIYYYTYTVGTRIFEDFGPTTQVTLLLTTNPGTNQVNITAIPVLANGATANYDTTVIKVKIYRTINNGTTFYYVGQVTNGTTTFTDNVLDSTIQANNILLYTEGDVLENDPPPIAKLIHITQDTAYYAHIKEGSEVIVNRLVQSKVGDPDSVPAANFTEVEDEIVGLSSVKGIPVLLCKKSVFRVDGAFDEVGGGAMLPLRISDAATCVSSQSVVQTINYVFWAGEDGIYMTEGFSVVRLSLGIRQTYAGFVSTATAKSRIQGKYDRRNNRIWWTVQSSNVNDVDKCLVLDLNWPLTEDSSFTTVSNSTSFSPSAIEFVGNTMYRGDSRGYIFLHSDTVFSDPKVDVSVSPSTWGLKTIIYNYISSATNFGSDFIRKFSPKVNVVCKNDTNLSLQVISINDDNKRLASLKPIRYRGNIIWGDPDPIWGDPSLIWNISGLIEETRRVPANNLRFSYKQIQLTNAFVVITSSDLFGTAVVDTVANTATLTNAVALDWPMAVVDYFIAFEYDNFQRTFQITVRTADVITFADVAGFSPPSGTYRWVIRGYPKGEGFHLLSYTHHVAMLGKTQQPYRASSTGELS